MEVIPVTASAEIFTCNAYLVLGERTVLVDTGTTSGVENVVAERTDDLDAVVATHQHSDHVGELGAVAEQLNPDAYAYVDHSPRTHELEDGDHVEMGDELSEVVYIPGHADDHVSLVSGRLSFSGDVFVYNNGAFGSGSFGCTDMLGQSCERSISSLHTLLDRLPSTVEALYAGYGDPFENEAGGDTIRDALERAIECAERREPKYPGA